MPEPIQADVTSGAGGEAIELRPSGESYSLLALTISVAGLTGARPIGEILNAVAQASRRIHDQDHRYGSAVASACRNSSTRLGRS